jgi:hypothetical protein
MKIAVIALSLFVCTASVARAATPAEEAARIALAMNERGPVTCRFAESHRFTFRKNPVLFSGTTLFIPGRGLLLAYESPEARRIGLSSAGVAVESGGKIARSGAPEGLTELPALYALDLEGLAKNSEVSFTVTGEEWSLFLTEKAPPVTLERAGVERSEKASIILFARAPS